VQRRLGDSQFGGDVGVAEPVESAHLCQPFGDVQDPRCGAGITAAAFSPHRLVSPKGLTADLLVGKYLTY
jgi:hypothetical protein